MAVLGERQIEEQLAGLSGWDRSGDAIRRVFTLGDFRGSVDFINRMTPIAEEMNHHPDLEISWSRVTVRLTTHSAGGLTDADFRLARRIDALA